MCFKHTSKTLTENFSLEDDIQTDGRDGRKAHPQCLASPPGARQKLSKPLNPISLKLLKPFLRLSLPLLKVTEAFLRLSLPLLKVTEAFLRLALPLLKLLKRFRDWPFPSLKLTPMTPTMTDKSSFE